MKLSKLIAYRSLLDSYDPKNIHQLVGSAVDPFLHAIETNELQFPAAARALNDQHQVVIESLIAFEARVADFRKCVQDQINEIEPQYLLESYRLYEEMQHCDTAEYILSRRLKFDEDTMTFLRGRIQLFSDWHRAGMIIRPGLESWVDDLVALDPLYLVDHEEDLLTPAQQRFNPDYRRRLRSYKIQEDRENAMLGKLPDNQFGFCLAYNFFNYKPFEIVRGYLTELYNKLIPGGVVAMTINDCDYSGAVDLCERKFMCYLPGSMVCGVASSIGFRVSLSKNLDRACTWLELEKPGNFKSLKGGQSLAMILPKPIDSSTQ